MSSHAEVKAFLNKLAVALRQLDDANERRTGDGSPEALQARVDYVTASGEVDSLHRQLQRDAIRWLGMLSAELDREISLGKLGVVYAGTRDAGTRWTLSDLLTDLTPLMVHLDLVPPAMKYGHHEEVLVQLIREQGKLLLEMADYSEHRWLWFWRLKPNDLQVVANQRARAAAQMIDHMGLGK